MKTFIHYILIAIMFNWNVAVFAEDKEDCKWEVVEETKIYLHEQCVGGDGYQARIRSKDVNGEVGEFKVVGKQADPIKKFKDKVEEAPKATAKVEKLEKIEQEVIVTEKKIKELKEEKNIAEKIEVHVEEKKLAETPVEETEKPIIKEEIAKIEAEKKSDEKLVEQATEKEWADVDAEQEITWMQFHELLPRLIVENEKIKAAELDYEAAVESLKSEYTA